MAACLPAAALSCLDLGSGGGVPGLVLAAGSPGLKMVLLDARGRRCRFLRRAVEGLGLSGRVSVVESRAESAARLADLREAMDAVVARSFGPPAVTAESATGFLRLGGRLVVSEPPEEEAGGVTRWSEEGLDALGLGPPVVCARPDASFVWFEKRRSDDRWPRRSGIPSKRPLWRV